MKSNKSKRRNKSSYRKKERPFLIVVAIAAVTFLLTHYSSIKEIWNDFVGSKPEIVYFDVNSFDEDGNNSWVDDGNNYSLSDCQAISLDADITSYYDWWGDEIPPSWLQDNPHYYAHAGMVAFSLKTTLKNPNTKPLRLDSVQTEIISCEPITKSDVIYEMIIIDSTLKLYAINNGWGDSNVLSPDVGCTIMGEDYPLSQIAIEEYALHEFSLSVGQVLQFAQYTLDNTSFWKTIAGKNEDILKRVVDGNYAEAAISYYEEIAPSNGLGGGAWVYLYDADIYVNGNGDGFCRMPLKCSEVEGGFFFLLAEGFGDSYEKESRLFSVIDVDLASETLNNTTSRYIKTYTSPDASPQIEDTYIIETVIAATKSCNISCRNIFHFGNLELKTDLISLSLIVPVYKKGAITDYIGYCGSMIESLAELNNTGTRTWNDILSQYRYRANEFKISEPA